jgi:acyl-CoA synthetase (AMP-forming)/AMP-acid ligase II
VIYAYRMALANYVNIGSTIELRSTDTVAAFLPLFHTAGINLHALPVLIAGGTVLLLETFDAEILVGLIEGRAPRHLLRRPDRLSGPARSSPLRRPRRSTPSATGAAAARPCPTAWRGATARSACASATAWA